MEKQKSRRLIKNFSNMSLKGTWRKATGLPNGVGESKVYGIDFILIVSLFSLFRRRFQTDGHLVVQSTPISPVIEPFSAESNRNRVCVPPLSSVLRFIGIICRK